MIEDVIPAIEARMPRSEGLTIFSQQDGAKPHTKTGMEAIKEVAGDDIVIEMQPVNSPDLHANDLGYFHSIKQLRKTRRNQ
ncbi:unnamed protein product, partial [Choristocarpus tenellus]